MQKKKIDQIKKKENKIYKHKKLVFTNPLLNLKNYFEENQFLM